MNMVVNVFVLLVLFASVLALCWRDLFAQAPGDAADSSSSRVASRPSVPNRGDSGQPDTDALFDVSAEGLYRHLLVKLLEHRPSGDPQREIDFYGPQAEVCMYLGFDTMAYDCAKDAASYAFQLKQSLRPPQIERRKVPVLPFRPVVIHPISKGIH